MQNFKNLHCFLPVIDVSISSFSVEKDDLKKPNYWMLLLIILMRSEFY